MYLYIFYFFTEDEESQKDVVFKKPPARKTTRRRKWIESIVIIEAGFRINLKYYRIFTRSSYSFIFTLLLLPFLNLRALLSHWLSPALCWCRSTVLDQSSTSVKSFAWRWKNGKQLWSILEKWKKLSFFSIWQTVHYWTVPIIDVLHKT